MTTSKLLFGVALLLLSPHYLFAFMEGGTKTCDSHHRLSIQGRRLPALMAEETDIQDLFQRAENTLKEARDVLQAKQKSFDHLELDLKHPGTLRSVLKGWGETFKEDKLSAGLAGSGVGMLLGSFLILNAPQLSAVNFPLPLPLITALIAGAAVTVPSSKLPSGNDFSFIQEKIDDLMSMAKGLSSGNRDFMANRVNESSPSPAFEKVEELASAFFKLPDKAMETVKTNVFAFMDDVNSPPFFFGRKSRNIK